MISYQSIEFVNILLKDISQIDLVPFMTHFSSYVITYMFSFIKYVNLHICDNKNRSNKTQFILNAEERRSRLGQITVQINKWNNKMTVTVVDGLSGRTLTLCQGI